MVRLPRGSRNTTRQKTASSVHGIIVSGIVSALCGAQGHEKVGGYWALEWNFWVPSGQLDFDTAGRLRQTTAGLGQNGRLSPYTRAGFGLTRNEVGVIVVPIHANIS